MCRQFHDAYGTSIAVLRPCSIIDTRLRLSKYDAELKSGSWGTGLVCRHDLAEACRLAIEKDKDDLGFQVLHMAGAAEADLYYTTPEKPARCWTWNLKGIWISSGRSAEAKGDRTLCPC